MLKRLFQLISDIIHPPRGIYSDFHEEAGYVLTYRMYIFLWFTLGVLGVILFVYYGPLYSVMSFIGFAAVTVSFWFIRKTGRYKRSSAVFNLLGAVLCQVTLWGIVGQPHLIDGLWMVINIMFVFMTVNKAWGIGISLLHGVALSSFYYFNFESQIPLIEQLTDEQLFGVAINVMLCFMIIFYLSWQNIITNQRAQDHLTEARETLQKQFDIINKQNEEKTMMLKEIHHRVKNNLQVITSLLRLQSRELENEEAISKFRETTNRVIAMSMIHEKMYQSEELSKINLEEYFSSLADDLLNSYQVGFPIEITIQCSIETLGMRPIVPLALIFNELFSNSLKYAFKHTENARINVDLIHTDEHQFVLTYQDNGQWKTPDRADSFGLELISALTEQLEGKMKFQCTPQTMYIFDFPNLDL